MELSSAIIGLACIALFVVPIYLLSKTGNQKQKQQMRVFLAFCSGKGLNLTQKEAWNDCAIGIDETSNQLVYVKDTEGGRQEVLIDLNEVAQCNIVNSSREVKSGGSTQRVIERLDLQFLFKKSGKTPETLEFYNARKQYQLSGEFQLIEKWLKIIRQAI